MAIESAITYGPSGASFAVWQGERVVLRAKTEEGAKAAALQLAAAVGGDVQRREPSRPAAPRDASTTAAALGDANLGPTVDLAAVLALSITKLRERLAIGDLDDHLAYLEAAERAGANRKGAIDAIGDRMKATP